MLVLSRKVGERLVIGNDVTVIVNRVAGNRVTLGIEAPAAVSVQRQEIRDLIQRKEADSEQRRAD
jgi:carbon storage regulator